VARWWPLYLASPVQLPLGLSLLLLAGGSFANPAVAQTTVVNPVPQGSPIPRVLPRAPPSVAPGTVTSPPSAPGAEVPNQPVRVTSVGIDGATVYSQPELAQLTAGLVGPAVPLARIDAARDAILQRYRADGYVLSPSYSLNQLATICYCTRNKHTHTSMRLGGPHFRPCR